MILHGTATVHGGITVCQLSRHFQVSTQPALDNAFLARRRDNKLDHIAALRVGSDDNSLHGAHAVALSLDVAHVQPVLTFQIMRTGKRFGSPLTGPTLSVNGESLRMLSQYTVDLSTRDALP